MPIGANDNWWVTIEGVGDYDNVSDGVRDRLYRFSFSNARWETDPAPLYKGGWLVRNSLKVSKNNLDFRAGRSSSGGGSFALKMKELVLSTFMRFRHLHTAILDGEIDALDTTIRTNTTSNVLANTIQYVDREAIFFGGYSGIPVGTYINCVRGVFGTLKTPHKDLHKIYPQLKAINRRQVTIGYTPEGATDYSDEVVFRKFQIQDDGSPHTLTYESDLDGWLALLSLAPILPNQWTGVYVDATGDDEGNLVQISFKAAPVVGSDDIPLPMTFRRPLVRFPAVEDGDRVLVEIDGHIFRGTLAEYQTDAADTSVVAGYTVEVNLAKDLQYSKSGPDLKFADASKITCREIFCSDPTAPDNGFFPATALASGSLPLGGGSANLLTYVLQVLTSTEWGTNGDYDVGIEFGLGIPHIAIDIAGIEALRDRSTGIAAPRFFLGREADKGAKLLHLLERDLRVPGFAFAENSEGIFTVAGWEDSSLVTVDSLRDTNLAKGTIIQNDNGTANTIDSVSLVFDRGGDGRTRPLVFKLEENSDERLGPEQGDAVDAGSWVSQDWAGAHGYAWVERWGSRIPKLRLKAKIEKSFNTGQAINLTSNYVVGVDPDTKNPVIGVETSRCLVVHVDPDLHKGTIGYHLLHTGLKYNNLGNIAGAMQVLGELGPDLTLTDNVFVPLNPVTGVTNHAAGWRHDREAFEITDKVQLLSDIGVHIAYGVVDSFPVNEARIEISAFLGLVSDGDYVVHRAWDDMTSSQQSRMAALAKPNDKLGSGDDPGFQYEGS